MLPARNVLSMCASAVEREGVKYVLVFNPKAKRYSRALEASLVKQAARLLGGNGAVTYTTPQVEGGGAL